MLTRQVNFHSHLAGFKAIVSDHLLTLLDQFSIDVLSFCIRC